MERHVYDIREKKRGVDGWEKTRNEIMRKKEICPLPPRHTDPHYGPGGVPHFPLSSLIIFPKCTLPSARGAVCILYAIQRM